MKIELEIDQEEILAMAKEVLMREMKEQIQDKVYCLENRILKTEAAQACHDVIYAEKDRIVEIVVSQATAEVKRRGIQKFLKALEDDAK